MIAKTNMNKKNLIIKRKKIKSMIFRFSYKNFRMKIRN